MADNNNIGSGPSQTSSKPSIADMENDMVLIGLENIAREGLREVYDPELGMSVIELGLIRKFDWEPEKVEVTMILTTPFCPYGPAMIEQIRQKVQDTTQRVARVTMGLEMWDPSMMEDQAAANWGLYY